MSKQKRAAAVSVLFAAAIALGCAPRIVARRLPSNGAIAEASSAAIPFYPPRPYLLVTHHMSDGPGGAAAEKAKKATPEAPAAPLRAGHTLRIVYLPDLANRYGLEITRGTGSFDGSFTLKDGWMLTSLGAKSDNQLDESIAATAKLVESLGGVTGRAPTTLVAPALESADPGASFELIDLASGRCVLGWPDGCPQDGAALGPGLCGDGCREAVSAAESR